MLTLGWGGYCPRMLVVTVAAVATVVLSGLVMATGTHAAAPAVAVFPIPGDKVAAPSTQLTFRGVPATQLGALTVTGSKSGAHTGTVAGDSDGSGGSFLPAKPFAAGETVTVRTALNVLGARGGTYSFTVQTPVRPGAIRPLPMTPRSPHDVWNYVSRPDLQPAAVTVDKRSKGTAPGALFIAPQAGPVRDGPELLGPDGGLVWFHPVPKGQYVTDFREQAYGGTPALTWWQGVVNLSGIGHGVDEIYDSSYRHVATVKAANGLDSDLHEFQLTPQGTAFVTAYQPVLWNASAIKHGSKHEILLDAVVQEIDIKTGLVLFQWDSLDHVGLSASYSPVAQRTGTPWDYFHVNSIQPQPDGSLVVSARNTSQIYRISGQTGTIDWKLGGKHPSFKMGARTQFYFQHDARMRAPDTITIFDDGGQPFYEKQSRSLTLRLNTSTKTATLVSRFFHSPPLKAAAEGNVDLLPNGNQLVGWGAAPFVTEFDTKGREVFDAHFNAVNASYRAYRAPWQGAPPYRPAIGTRVSRGRMTVYASWNGFTGGCRWQVLGGPSPTRLKPVGDGAKRAFETSFRLRRAAYVAVQALDRHGKLLRTSETIKAS